MIACANRVPIRKKADAGAAALTAFKRETAGFVRREVRRFQS